MGLHSRFNYFNRERPTVRCISAFLLSALLVLSTRGAIITCPTCSQSDFENAYYNLSAPGDTIVLPAGTATWGAAARPNEGVIFIITNVTVVGQGDSTVITLDDTGKTYAGGVIACWAAATFKHFKIVGSDVAPVTAFSVSAFAFTTGFRISDITYDGRNGGAYFAYIATGVIGGLIDNCRLSADNLQSELIVGRGPTNSWQVASTVGTADNIFIEDCTFSTAGYTCDANSNAHFVVRHNTIAGNNKIDGHGMDSNSPPRSVRNMEVYDNVFTKATGPGSYQDIELRGGTGMVFNNSSVQGWLLLTTYGDQAMWANYNYLVQTPYNYPLFDQIGTGQDITINATAITAGQCVRINLVGTTDFTAIGAPDNNFGTLFNATGPGTGTGNVTTSPATAPMYVFKNTQGGSPWPRTTWLIQNIDITTDGTPASIGAIDIKINPLSVTVNKGNAFAITGDNTRYVLSETKFQTALDLNDLIPPLVVAIPASSVAIHAGANPMYQYQLVNPSVTFDEKDIIRSNRDFYSDAGFDTNTGVSVGTKASMNAYTPSFTGYGWWVTDEGSWNTTLPANTSGVLYRWSGSAWVLFYTPYTYPHPLRENSALTAVAANITTLRVGP